MPSEQDDPRSDPQGARPGPVPLGRAFWIVWGGQTVSTLGSTLAGVGIAVHVYARTGSVAWLGALLALAALPAIAVVPFLGIVDRTARRSVMIGADLVAASGSAVALVMALAGHLELWHLAVVGVVAGIGNAMQFPAYQAAIPELVRPEAIARANGLVQLAPALAIVVGPATATVLLGVGGVGAILAVDLATCAVAVVATASVRFGAVTRRSTDGRGPEAARCGARTRLGTDTVVDDASSTSAWRWLRTDGRVLLSLMGVVAAVNLALSVFNVSLLALATDLGGPSRAGLAPTIGGLAMIAVSLVLARRGLPADRGRTIAAALAVIGLGVAVTGARPTFAAVVVGVAVAMGAVPIANAAASTIFHERVPAHLQGRVFGLRAALGRALEPVGNLTAGLVVATLAAPVVAADGAVGTAVRAAVGDGPARDTALVAVVLGASLVAGSAVFARSVTARRLVGTDAGVASRPGVSGDDAQTPGSTPRARRSAAEHTISTR